MYNNASMNPWLSFLLQWMQSSPAAAQLLTRSMPSPGQTQPYRAPVVPMSMGQSLGQTQPYHSPITPLPMGQQLISQPYRQPVQAQPSLSFSTPTFEHSPVSQPYRQPIQPFSPPVGAPMSRQAQPAPMKSPLSFVAPPAGYQQQARPWGTPQPSPLLNRLIAQ